MKICLAALVLLLFPAVAGAAELPMYNTVKYCYGLAAHDGGAGVFNQINGKWQNYSAVP